MQTEQRNKHTPGPWRYHRVNSYFSVTNDPSAFSGKWCGCLAKTPERECDTAKEEAKWIKQDQANAALIAAAPEILEALKLSPLDLHKADERGACLCSQCEFRRAARAAIAKATIQ